MEELHLLVQEEGRAAKHAAFSVPVEPLLSPRSDSEHGATSPSYASGTGHKNIFYLLIASMDRPITSKAYSYSTC